MKAPKPLHIEIMLPFYRVEGENRCTLKHFTEWGEGLKETYMSEKDLILGATGEGVAGGACLC